MFGFWRRLKDLEEENAAMRGAFVDVYAQLEALHLLGSEIFEYLPNAQRLTILERMKEFIGKDLKHANRLQWLTDDEQQRYNDQLSSFLQMYIEDASRRSS